jgi:hypothetical protein
VTVWIYEAANLRWRPRETRVDRHERRGNLRAMATILLWKSRQQTVVCKDVNAVAFDLSWGTVQSGRDRLGSCSTATSREPTVPWTVRTGICDPRQ